MSRTTPSNLEALAAYANYERQVTIRHLRVGCLLAMVLMPAGMILDWAVYPDRFIQFATIRFACSALEAGLFFALQTEAAKRFSQLFSLTIAMLPVISMCVMIAVTEGARSPYYAGLNLVILSIAFVLRWTVGLSLAATLLVIIFYLGSCAAQAPLNWSDGILINNLYFLSVTGLIVVIGGRIHSALRVSEFEARFELDQKKAELEVSNTELAHQKRQLEHAYVELQRAQDQLVFKEKQASLGVWSAGIIHEMNNPLNFARTGLYALRNKEKHLPPGEQPDFKELVADIEDGIKRVHTIVSDLRTYAHPGKVDDHEEVLVDDVVRVALRFFSSDLQGRVEVVKNIPEGMSVFVNRNKLIQVLGNLLQNSVDALKSKSFDGAHPVITIEGRHEKARSLIVVRDNGPGIKKEDLGKIFDPFFTTKDVGQGMGLGLGICYRIIQGFGGSISVRSEPGEYCEITLDLPAERPEPAAT